MNYRREIDGLRALAVLPVIFFHAGLPPFYGGYVGVDIFFVISGYLITSIILADLKSGKFSLANFYERRARRILPALFLVLAVSLPLAWLLLLPGDMQDFSQSIAAIALFASNFLFWSESGYFSTAAELKPMLHTWTLAVEEQYYIFFPLFMMLAWRFKQRWIVALLALAAILSLAVAHLTVGFYPMIAFFLLPTRGWELLLGALVAFYLAERAVVPNSRLANTASMVGLMMILMAIFLFTKKTPIPSFYTLLPTIGASLIILFASHGTIVGKLLGSSVAVGIGLISYSAYLWHQPLFAFARHGMATEPGFLVFGFLSMLTLGMACLSWRYVEQPFRNRGWLSRKTIFTWGAIGTLFFVGIGLLGHFTNGLESRYAPADRYLAGIRATEAGAYVSERFRELRWKDFDARDSRKKILVIGDSYGQDLVNGIYESKLINHFQISTHHVSSRCGNLYLQEDFTEHIEKNDKPNCFRVGWYDNPKLHQLMKEADSIWLASSWRPWQADLLPQSVENIRRDFNKKVIVFGTKNFGDVSIKRLLQHPRSERVMLEASPSEQMIRVNEIMQSNLDRETFVDVFALLCKNRETCRLFTDEGKLISYDGGHLTVDGARYYGEELSKHPIVKHILERGSQ